MEFLNRFPVMDMDLFMLPALILIHREIYGFRPVLSDHPVYVIKKDKTWQKLEFEFPGFGVGTRVGDILPTSFNQQWLLIERYGILVFSVDEKRFIDRTCFYGQKPGWGDCLTGFIPLQRTGKEIYG